MKRASYQIAVWWIAHNDGAGDTPDSLPYADAFDVVHGQVTTCLVSDLFDIEQSKVAADVLKLRGFQKPKE